MICDTAVVTKMVPTPHDDVISYSGERLDDVILKDETVFAYRRPVIYSLRTNVGNATVTLSFYLFKNTLANAVHLGRTHRREHLEVLRRMADLQAFEGYNR